MGAAPCVVAQEGQYSQGALTPLALSWKDAGCSAWPVDTDPQGNALEFQVRGLCVWGGGQRHHHAWRMQVRGTQRRLLA